MVLAFALAIVASFLAYYPGLDNFFLEIDDPLHLLGASIGQYQSPHFRPMHEWWNRALFQLFGIEPAGWYLFGILLHAMTATVLAGFVLTLSGRRWQALSALLVFSTLFAPNEAVLWIGAHNALLLGFFALLSCWAWACFLSSGSRLHYTAAFLAMVGAMLSKESCVVLGPFFLCLDLVIRGPRGFLKIRTLFRYAPFALLAVVYLLIALRPEIWMPQEKDQGYTFGLDAIPKMWASMGHLWLPKSLDSTVRPSWTVLLGIWMSLLAVVGAWRFERQRPLLLFGLVVALLGFLAVLPTPMPVLGRRYAYVPSMGVAIMVAGFVGVCWEISSMHPRGALRALRPLVALGLLGFCALNIGAIHSAEPWCYEQRGRLLQTAMESTRRLIVDPLRKGVFKRPPVVLGSQIWNGQDYLAGVSVFLGVDRQRLDLSEYSWPEETKALVRRGGDLAPGSRALFAMSPDGEVYRVPDQASLPLETWSRRAERSEEYGLGLVLWGLAFDLGP